MKLQFLEVQPEEAKVGVKHHQPDSSEAAGWLVKDFKQAWNRANMEL